MKQHFSDIASFTMEAVKINGLQNTKELWSKFNLNPNNLYDLWKSGGDPAEIEKARQKVGDPVSHKGYFKEFEPKSNNFRRLEQEHVSI
jgi:hypothetical protein